MALSNEIGLGTAGYLTPIAAVLSLISLSAVAVGFALGYRCFGIVGAVICGGLCAVWPDLVYFAPKPLSEVQAGHFLIAAVGLTAFLPAVGRTADRWTGRRCALIGVVLSLVFCLRIQLAPTLLLIAVWAGRLELRRRWLPMTAAGLACVLMAGLLDWASLGSPFQSMWKLFAVNIIEGKARTFGEEGPLWYCSNLLRHWGAAVVAGAVFFVIGARRLPLAAATALTVVLEHSVIAHKEFSYIYPAIPPAIIVIGAGTSEVVLFLRDHLQPPMRSSRLLAATLGTWLLVALCVAGSGDFPFYWRWRWERLTALANVRSRADLCGLGVYDPGTDWAVALPGGYAYVDRKVPILFADSSANLSQAAPYVNYLLAVQGSVEDLSGFSLERCWSDACLMHANRTCASGDSPYEINALLKREHK